jgi:CRISPR-associated protein Csm3
MIVSFYDLDSDRAAEFNRLKQLILAMQLLEDDYLGGLGSRGSGKISFEQLKVSVRKGSELIPFPDLQGATLSTLVANQDTIVAWVRDTLTGD